MKNITDSVSFGLVLVKLDCLSPFSFEMALGESEFGICICVSLLLCCFTIDCGSLALKVLTAFRMKGAFFMGGS